MLTTQTDYEADVQKDIVSFNYLEMDMTLLKSSHTLYIKDFKDVYSDDLSSRDFDRVSDGCAGLIENLVIEKMSGTPESLSIFSKPDVILTANMTTPIKFLDPNDYITFIESCGREYGWSAGCILLGNKCHHALVRRSKPNLCSFNKHFVKKLLGNTLVDSDVFYDTDNQEYLYKDNFSAFIPVDLSFTCWKGQESSLGLKNIVEIQIPKEDLVEAGKLCFNDINISELIWDRVEKGRNGNEWCESDDDLILIIPGYCLLYDQY